MTIQPSSRKESASKSIPHPGFALLDAGFRRNDEVAGFAFLDSGLRWNDGGIMDTSRLRLAGFQLAPE